MIARLLGRTERLAAVPRSIAVGSATCAVAVVAAALGLRLWGLGAKSLWWDEAFTFFISSSRPVQIVSLVRANDAHPPLYYLLVHPLTFAWSPEFDVRLLSVLAGLLTVTAVYWFGRVLLGNRAAVIAAFLLAVSPVHVMASQEGRMYAVLGLLNFLSWATLWLAVQRGPRWWVAYALCTAAALYTHYLSLAVLLFQGGFVAVEPMARRVASRWIAAAGAAVAVFLPWTPALIEQTTAGRLLVESHATSAPLRLAEIGALYLFGGRLFDTAAYIAHQHGDLALVYYLPLLLPLLVVTAAGLAGLRGRRDLLAFFACALVLPATVILLAPLSANPFKARYAVIFVPVFLLLAALGVERIAAWWSTGGGNRSRARAAVLLWLGLFAAAGLEAHYRAPTWDGYDWRAGVRFVDANLRDLDTLVMIPGIINIPYQVYSQHARLTVLGDPRTYLEAARKGERDKLKRAYQDAAARGDVWLLTFLPISDRISAALAQDLRGAVSQAKERNFGNLRVIRYGSSLR